MTEETEHQCQLYLVTPPRLASGDFNAQLALILDTVPIAALRLSLDTQSEDVIAQSADEIRSTCHARDVPLLLADHYRIVRKLGLDGVHLQGTRDVRDARSELGDGASIGAFCGTSRHAGLTAGEIGADYVSFGPLTETALGSGEIATRDTFQWWHQMIELPCVAEGAMTPQIAKELKDVADFIVIGHEVWTAGKPPVEAIAEFAAAIDLL